jgi:hypothetical protein
MARVIGAPTVTTIALTQWDPSGETTVTIREPRFWESHKRSQFLGRSVVEHDTVGSREVRDVSWADLVVLELWLTYVKANVQFQGSDAEAASNLFVNVQNQHEFWEAVQLLPDELILEWHKHVIALNPLWGDHNV